MLLHSLKSEVPIVNSFRSLTSRACIANLKIERKFTRIRMSEKKIWIISFMELHPTNLDIIISTINLSLLSMLLSCVVWRVSEIKCEKIKKICSIFFVVFPLKLFLSEVFSCSYQAPLGHWFFFFPFIRNWISNETKCLWFFSWFDEGLIDKREKLWVFLCIFSAFHFIS